MVGSAAVSKRQMSPAAVADQPVSVVVATVVAIVAAVHEAAAVAVAVSECHATASAIGPEDSIAFVLPLPVPPAESPPIVGE